jgi:hypothetical protein
MLTRESHFDVDSEGGVEYPGYQAARYRGLLPYLNKPNRSSTLQNLLHFRQYLQYIVFLYNFFKCNFTE